MKDKEGEIALSVFRILGIIIVHLIIIGIIYLVCKCYGPKAIFKIVFNIISLRFIVKKIIRHILNFWILVIFTARKMLRPGQSTASSLCLSPLRTVTFAP